jgi:hypothetical protein
MVIFMEIILIPERMRLDHHIHKIFLIIVIGDFNTIYKKIIKIYHFGVF